jgi:NADH-quinone oxidoreductase subunit E
VSRLRWGAAPCGEPRTFPAEARHRIDQILKRYPTRQAALLPVLWVAQETWGWISREAVEEVARVLDLTPAFIEGVVTFYTMYNLEPMGRHLLQFCTSISCHLNGADRLVEHCSKKLGIGLGQTTPDGRFTLTEVECIAGCDRAPSLMVNDRYFEPMTPEKLDALIETLASGKDA